MNKDLPTTSLKLSLYSALDSTEKELIEIEKNIRISPFDPALMEQVVARL